MTSDRKMFDRSFLTRRTPPPPDYNSRGIRLKIFGLLACLFLVGAVAERARNPASWNWFFQLNQEQPQGRVSNRLPSQAKRTDDGDAVLVTLAASEDDDSKLDSAAPTKNPAPPATGAAPPAMAPPPPPEASATDPLAATWRDGWERVYVSLEQRERTDLFRLAAAGLSEHEVSSDDEPRLVDLIARIDRLWQAYATEAFQAVANLAEAERTPWLEVLRQANHRWSEELKRALTKASGGGTLVASEGATLRAWRATLDDIAFREVLDDSPLRPRENEAWFRLVARAQRGLAAEQTLEPALKPTDVSFLHLTQQSDYYRGQWVRVRGVAKWAYRSPANRNPWGAVDYNVLFIQPEDNTNAPIVVYALELPPGFPALPPYQDDQKLTKVHADVVVEGLFFKRWAYPGADGAYTAPLVITQRPEYVVADVAALSTRWEWNLGNTLLVVAGAVGMALVASGVILWRVRSHEQAPRAWDEQPFDPVALKDVPLSNPLDHLQRLQDEASGGAK